MAWNNKYSKSNPFNSKIIKDVIRCGGYGSIIYNISISHKPIVTDRCIVTITNLNNTETITLLIILDYRLVASKLSYLYEDHYKEIKDEEKSRQLRIKRYENKLKRLNKQL